MFKSIKDLNAAVAAHKRNHKLTKTEIAVLDVLARYSCKNIGKSWLAKNTIARLVGKSRRTVIRACNRLETLGIIRQYERRRETGDRRQTSNLIVIQPAAVTPAMSHQEAQSRNVKNNYLHNTYAPQPQPNPSFYDRFRNLIDSTLGNVDKRLIYRLYGVYKAHSTPLLRFEAFDRAKIETIGWQALKTAIMATKRKKIRDLAGYFNGVLDRMLDRLYFDEITEIVRFR
ncbi:helix-turn-helix domain-containing protein [Caldibacillus debilis]|uniref:Helix-turn-helix domain-containing protein n=1 Tax=Caldibacillus debilis TaxID=301148 RepID=A0A150L6Y8_9BACI|nr:helix-turn-helix domain-containing protein [Caldibacillus debilis]KYD08030.1 hypothetical protein B4135_4187 [Caldibacillus debilis]